MFQFFRDFRIHRSLRNGIMQKAELLCQQLPALPEDEIIEAIKKANLGETGGAFDQSGRRLGIRTPMEIKPFLEAILDYPPELSAYLVLYRLERALIQFRLPRALQGDIMMAFESANYVLPDKTPQAACHLAHAICIMPWLPYARATVTDLGAPYTEDIVSQRDIEILVKYGYLPQSALENLAEQTHLSWNLEIRRAVRYELEALSPHAKSLFPLEKL